MLRVVDRFCTFSLIQLFLGRAYGKKKRPTIGSCSNDELSVHASRSSGTETQQHKFKTGSCDKSKMTVGTSDGATKNKKRNCCPYCFKLQRKLARHIVTLHDDKKKVQELLTFPTGNF